MKQKSKVVRIGEDVWKIVKDLAIEQGRTIRSQMERMIRAAAKGGK